MNRFEERVNDFIRSEIEIAPEKGAVIVALSGGADSVALLAVLTALGYDCVAAHCNFHLRGEESDRDMEHAVRTAQRLCAVVETIHFNVPERMAAAGESMEMACRELRYEWFGQLKEKYHAQAVATGHHLEDNVETMLMNMLRGAGINGAAGILPRADRRVSPLLEMSKADILDYLQQRSLTYVTDSSNLSNDITRNRLRNGVLAQLERDFPGAMNRLSRSLSNLRDDAALLNDTVANWRKIYINGNKIMLDSLVAHEIHPAQVLFQILKPLGFRKEQCEAMLTAPSGSRFPAGEHEVVMNRSFAVLQKQGKEQMKPYILPSITSSNRWFTVDELVPEQFLPERDNGVIYLDADKLPDNAEWQIRPIMRGDRMEPFGMNGRSKLLSDILNDIKADSQRKHTTPVLTCNNRIVWLLGVRASNLYRVDHNTRRILRLTLTPDDM